MPLQLDDENTAPVCSLTKWEIQNVDSLVDALAWLYLRKLKHASRVIADFDPGPAFTPGMAMENAIEALSVRTDDIEADLRSSDAEVRKKAVERRDTRVGRRDSLLFQHLSWVAVHLRFANARACPPHVRQADKGFDGVLLEVDSEQTQLPRGVLCEDKASIAPRGLVTRSIWPEIKAIQASKKYREILAAITSILDTMPDVDQEAVLESTEWLRSCQFRVALTAGADQVKDGRYGHLFSGFEEAAGGEIESRIAEVFLLTTVRANLDDLAVRVINNLRERLARV